MSLLAGSVQYAQECVAWGTKLLKLSHNDKKHDFVIAQVQQNVRSKFNPSLAR